MFLSQKPSNVLLPLLLGFPRRVRRRTVLLEDWQGHPGHHFPRQNRAGAGVPRKAGKQRLLQDLSDIVACVHRLILGGTTCRLVRAWALMAPHTMVLAGCFGTKWGGTEAFSFTNMRSF